MDSAQNTTKNLFLLGKYLTKESGILIIQNNQDAALKSSNKAMKIAEYIEDEKMICEVILVKVELDRLLGRHNEAIDKLDQAYEIMNKKGCDDVLCVRILDRYASIYSAISGETAKKYSLMALELATKLNERHSMAVSHNELGYNYEHTGNFDSSLFHYKKAIEIWKSLKTPIYTSNALSNIGRLYKKNKQPRIALGYLLEAEKMIRNTSWYQTKFQVYANLETIYLNFGDSVNFYKMKSLHNLAGSYIIGASIEDNIVGYEKQFEQSENLRIIEKQESELELKKAESELEKRRANQFLVLSILSSLGLFGAVLWLRQTIKNRKRISQINKELEEAIVIKEGLLKEIHHRVKNNLQMISGLLTIQAKNTSDEMAKKALLDSKARLKAVSMVHKRLYVGESYNQVDIASFLKDVVSSYVHSELRSQDVFNLEHDDFNVHI